MDEDLNPPVSGGMLATSALRGEMRVRAMIMLVAASIMFALMAFVTKIVSSRIPGAQVAVIRFVVSLAPILVPAVRRAAFRVQRLDLLAYRGIFGGFAVLLFFTAIEHIPVGTATLLNYTSPVFAGIFAAVFLGENLHARVLVPLGATLSGVALVSIAHQSATEILGFGPFELAGLGSAVMAGAAVTAMRGARRTESTWATLMSFSFVGLIATMPFGIWKWISPRPFEWALLVLVGLFALAGQLLMTWSYRWIETLPAGVVAQSSVVVAMALGAIFLGEELGPLNLAGTALTIGGVIAVITMTGKSRVLG